MLEASVVVCTQRNRPFLVETLDAVARQAAGRAEVVVVWSGVSPQAVPPDDLNGWLRDSTWPVRIIFEPQAGVATARARGLEAASCDVVVFIDDDAVPRPGWLAALISTMRSGAAAAGGTILPVWPAGDRPWWLPERLGTYFGERHAGSAAAHLPFGANMAIRRSVAREVGGLRPTLGHRGTKLGLHEETELCARLAAAGHVVAESPGAVVDHLVRSDQLQIRWVLRRAHAEGRSDAIRDGAAGASPVRLAKLVALAAAWPLVLVAPRAGVYVTARIASNVGYLAERLGIRSTIDRRTRDAHALASPASDRRPTG